MINKNVFDKFFLGFGQDAFMDSFTKTADRLAKVANYPPFNVKKVDENKFSIEMAVAGFTTGQLDIEVKDNKLVVSGLAKEDDKSEYLYKGLASRSFKREWVLADSIEVTSSELMNGILSIALETISTPVKKVNING